MSGALALVGAVEVLSDLLEIMTHDDSDSGGMNCTLDPYCRVAVYPGLEVPFDTCEVDDCGKGADGQLWATVQGVTPYPTNTGTGCDTYQWTAKIGSVRCAAKPGEDGAPPSVEAVQADAARQAIDADAIMYAIRCCAPKVQRLRDAAMVVTTWVPLGPDGGCVGGEWTITGRFDVCC